MITDNPKTFWDNISLQKNWREYILPKRTDESFEEEGKKQALEIQQFIDLDDIVLEYGCGIGRILKYIKAKKKVGVDICGTYIEKAKKDKTSQYYLVGECKEKADFIFSLSVLQHNNSKERIKIIQDIKNLLKTNGRALISFPHKDSLNYKETAFVHKFTQEEVEQYGKMFSDYQVIEGNLINYGDNKKCPFNEYFLLAIK
jgi:SAM-dependent methyltransferase